MESALFSFIMSALEKGFVTEPMMILLIIGMLIVLYKYILRPIYDKVKTLPSTENVQEIIDTSKHLEEAEITEIIKTLDDLTTRLGEIQDFSKENQREIREMKRDIASVKQILNQFQGHLMYNRSSDFGNRELK